MYLKKYHHHNSLKHSKSLFGIELIISTGVYAVSETIHIFSQTAYSHTDPLKSSKLFSNSISDVDPRGSNVVSLVNRVSFKNFVIGRMVYENALRLRLQKLKSISKGISSTVFFPHYAH